MTLNEIKSWNGKEYNGVIYLNGNKITEKEQIRKVKAFHLLLNDFLDGIKEIRNRPVYSDEIYFYLAGKNEELIYQSMKQGFVYWENAFSINYMGGSLAFELYDDLSSGKLFNTNMTPKEFIEKEIKLLN